MRRLTVFVALFVWSLVVVTSLWVQRSQLDRTVEALARNDAMANLRKDMAIRKWASSLGGVFVNEARVPNIQSLTDQERIPGIRATGEAVNLVALTPIHILLGVQETHAKEYGVKERLTSLQLRNRDNSPDDWEGAALKELAAGAPIASEVVRSKGGHGLMRVMIPMRMDHECLECHRDTLVPVGGLRGGAAISVNLDTYREAQEPAWRAVQFGHLGVWLLGVLTIFSFAWAARRRQQEREKSEENRRENDLAFSAMAEGAIITDAEGSILWANQAFSHISGYSHDEVIGRKPSLLKSGRHSDAEYAALWHQLKTVGEWRGELWNRRKSGEIFPEEISIRALRADNGQIRRFISIISDITERKLSESRIRRMALHDALTDLPNRNLLEEIAPKILAQAERDKKECAVIFFDLDRFKQVNDSLGHAAGDDLLIEAARRLGACFREGDTLARVGGDEFVALIGPEKNVAGVAAEIAQRSIESLFVPFDIRGSTFALGTSLGIAIYPGDGKNWQELAKNADTALYVAKNSGRGAWRFFEAEMNAGELERAKLRSQITTALEAQQLFLVYQPQFELRSGRLSGFEALIRWRHGNEILLPGAFLPLIEGTWVMRRIGVFVATEVVRQLRAWIDAGFDPVPVFINASPLDLAGRDFCRLLCDLCDQQQLSRDLLCVEVLESALESALAEAEIHALAEAGFKIAIDDFGTGYSSLSRLHQLPISKVKLDRSFVSRLPDDAKAVSIARATVGVAQDLGIAVIAEGLETEAQRQKLLDLDCTYGQGWLLGRPLTADRADVFLGQRVAALLQEPSEN